MNLRIIRNTIIIFLSLCLFIPQLTAHGAYHKDGQTPSGIPFSEMGTQINELIMDHLNQTTPGAAVIVMKDGEIIFSKGYGYADIEKGIPIDPAATVFAYASVSKPFVWVAVMQLAEQGLLDLDEDINTYLPPDFIFKMPFTMRDLLNHAAGFEDSILDAFVDEQALGELTLEEALLFTQPLQIYEPGVASAYSNWGTNLAAYIISRVSGQDFAGYITDHIFTPLGMSSLSQPDWLNNHTYLQSKAIGYDADGAGGFSESATDYTYLYASGGIYGTAIDLVYFMDALMPPQEESSPLFENTDTLSTLFLPSSLDPVNYPGTHHGFMKYSGTVPAYGHDGSYRGFSSTFAIVPEERFGVVALINASGEGDIIFGIKDLLIGKSAVGMDISHGTNSLHEGDSFQNTANLEGHYIMMRRFGNLVDMGNYIVNPIFKVTSIDKSAISISAGGWGAATFVQTEPYVFQLVETALPMLYGRELRFRMEDGKPVQIHIGNGADLSPLPPGRSMAWLMTSVVSAVGCILFFLITPMILSLSILLKKNSMKTRFRLLYNCFLLSGTLLVINNLTCIVRLVTNPYQTSANMVPHIWINYMLGSISVLFFILPLLYWHKEEIATRSKALYSVTALFTALLLFLLQNWNFFVLL